MEKKYKVNRSFHDKRFKDAREGNVLTINEHEAKALLAKNLISPVETVVTAQVVEEDKGKEGGESAAKNKRSGK